MVVAFVIIMARRRSRQRRALVGLQARFPDCAKVAFRRNLPALDGTIANAQFAELFDWIYAEHLRRYNARDFGDLMGKSIDLGNEADVLSHAICDDAVERLPPAAIAVLDRDAAMRDRAGAAIYEAMQMAGGAVQSELDAS